MKRNLNIVRQRQDISTQSEMERNKRKRQKKWEKGENADSRCFMCRENVI